MIGGDKQVAAGAAAVLCSFAARIDPIGHAPRGSGRPCPVHAIRGKPGRIGRAPKFRTKADTGARVFFYILHGKKFVRITRFIRPRPVRIDDLGGHTYGKEGYLLIGF